MVALFRPKYKKKPHRSVRLKQLRLFPHFVQQMGSLECGRQGAGYTAQQQAGQQAHTIGQMDFAAQQGENAAQK